MKLLKKFRYTNDKETREFELPIKVSTEFKFFFTAADVPEELHSFADYIGKRRYFDSFSELERYIDEMIEKYEASFIHETREKVIVYAFITEEVYRCDAGERLTLAYSVVWKYSTGAGKETRYLKEQFTRGETRFEQEDPLNNISEQRHRDNKIQEMPWTAEREAWFEALVSQLGKLKEQIKKGIGGNAPVLARKIDQNVKLLPGVTE